MYVYLMNIDNYKACTSECIMRFFDADIYVHIQYINLLFANVYTLTDMCFSIRAQNHLVFQISPWLRIAGPGALLAPLLMNTQPPSGSCGRRPERGFQCWSMPECSK